MNDDYLENLRKLNNEMVKKNLLNKFFKYLKDNFIAILALIISIIGLFK